MDKTHSSRFEMSRSQKSRMMSTTPASSKSRSMMSNKSRMSDFGINEVSQIFELSSSSSSSEDDEEDVSLDENRFQVPVSNALEPVLNSLKNTHTRGVTKSDKVSNDSEETPAEYVELINKDKTEGRQIFNSTLQKLDAKLERLAQENLETAAEFAALEQELEDAQTMKHPSLGQAKQEFARTTAQLAKVEKKLEHYSSMAKAMKKLIEKCGFTLAQSDDPPFTAITYNDITKEDTCFLYFSCFDVPKKFHVDRALPDFKEFSDLAKEVNETQNFKKLLIQARHYFDRDARQLDKELEDFCSPTLENVRK